MPEEVDQRRLKSIYDALDSRNNKQALKLIDKELSKAKPKVNVPTRQMIMVLRGLAHVRMGTEVEHGLSITDHVVTEQPTDDVVLQTILLVYQAACKHDKIAALYEQMWAANPKVESIGVKLFVSHFKDRNYLKAQQAAMKLMRGFKDPGYQYWAALSMFMQYEVGGKAMMLNLAAGVLKKALDGGHMDKLEQLKLYLQVLSAKGDHSEVLAILERDDCAALFLQPEEALLAKAEVYTQLDKHGEAYSLYKQLVKENNPDDWQWYMSMLDAASKADQWQDAGSFLRQQASAEQQHRPVRRGPLLAVIEYLARELSEAGERILPFSAEGKPQVFTEFTTAVCDYLKTFASKISCFDDLRRYLERIPASATQELSDSVVATITQVVTSMENERSKAWALGNQRMTQYVLRTLPLTFESANTIFSEYLQFTHPCDVKNEQGAKPGVDERQNSDDLLLVCCHILRYLAQQREGDMTPLVEMTAALEIALEKSKYNYQFKLWLMELYTVLGSTRMLKILYDSLDIKYTLTDSLSQFILEPSLRTGQLAITMEACSELAAFHGGARREIPDVIGKALQGGGYSRLAEIRKFHARIDHSHHLAVANVSNTLLQVINGAADGAAVKGALFEPLPVDPASYAQDEVCAAISFNQDYAARLELDYPTTTGETPCFNVGDLLRPYAAPNTTTTTTTTTPCTALSAIHPTCRISSSADKLTTLSLYARIISILRLITASVPLSEEDLAFPGLSTEAVQSLAVGDVSQLIDQAASAVDSLFPTTSTSTTPSVITRELWSYIIALFRTHGHIQTLIAALNKKEGSDLAQAHSTLTHHLDGLLGNLAAWSAQVHTLFQPVTGQPVCNEPLITRVHVVFDYLYQAATWTAVCLRTWSTAIPSRRGKNKVSEAVSAAQALKKLGLTHHETSQSLVTLLSTLKTRLEGSPEHSAELYHSIDKFRLTAVVEADSDLAGKVIKNIRLDYIELLDTAISSCIDNGMTCKGIKF